MEASHFLRFILEPYPRFFKIDIDHNTVSQNMLGPTLRVPAYFIYHSKVTQKIFWLKDKVLHRWLNRPYPLHTIDYGGDGPTMILLHGIASSSANWDYLLPLIRSSYHCISIDLLGFGDSPKPQWARYTMEEHCKAVEQAIKRLRIKPPFILVGHSLGSLLATRYARTHPGRVNRLVLLSPPVYSPLYTIKSRAARQRTLMYLKAYKFLRSNRPFSSENLNRLRRIFPQLKFLLLNEETWTPFIRTLEQCIENQTLIDDIRHVDVPTDVFYGILDEVVVPYNVKQLITIRELTLHPLNVSHAVTKRYAAAVAAVLLPEITTTSSELPPGENQLS
jgi:pimeloyl-ACP methyl ester carboxylesterase